MAWIDKGMLRTTCTSSTARKWSTIFARYGSTCQFDYVYPSIVSLSLRRPRKHLPVRMRIGFLANLTLAKGLDLVIATFRGFESKGSTRTCVWRDPVARGRPNGLSPAHSKNLRAESATPARFRAAERRVL